MSRLGWIRLMFLLFLSCPSYAFGQDNEVFSEWFHIAVRLDLAGQAARILEDRHLLGQAGTSTWHALYGRLYERAGRPAEAIRAYETMPIGFQNDHILLRVVVLYAEHAHEIDTARGAYRRLATNYAASPLTYIGRATILRSSGETGSAKSCIDSGLARFPGNNDLLLARFRFSILDGDTVNFQRYHPTPDAIASADVGDILEIGQLIRDRLSLSSARRFFEAVEKNSRDPYAIWRRLATLYRELGMLEEECRVLESMCSTDSGYFHTVRVIPDPTSEQAVARSVKADIFSRFMDDANELYNISLLFEKQQKYAQARMAFERYLSLPFLESAQGTIELERIMILTHLEGNIKRSQDLARKLLQVYDQMIIRDPFAFHVMVQRAMCFYILDDVLNAETELRLHSRRANDVERRAAVASLTSFAARGINKPDVLATIAKYYGDISSVPKPLADTTSRPPSVARMALESFTESSKVNPEPDKAYVLVRSLVPMLRFDSNRTIHKVEQLTSGDWELWLPAGTHILKIDAIGFQRLELPPINFGRRRSYEISIRKAVEE